MTTTLTEAFYARAGKDLDLIGTVVAVSRIPYGRPRDLNPAGVVADWRGTCSTKHLLLAALLAESWPRLSVALWRRVYSHCRSGSPVVGVRPWPR